MPLPLPNLDDRRWTDLVEEARALIPTFDPSWTDHNPSDPGITLVELFAWVAEMLIYRANRVPDGHLLTFLRLLNGPEWFPGVNLQEDVRNTILSLRRRDRAVTLEDYEILAHEASSDVARAKCVARRYLGAGTEAAREAPRPGNVSIIVLPRSADPAPQPSEELRLQVWLYLDDRRVLTTRHHVVGPVYAPVAAEVLIARRADVPPAALRDRVVEALIAFLDPLSGGPDGGGWPFGRSVYVSELYRLLEGIPGVDHIPELDLTSGVAPGERDRVAAHPAWHEDGELVGLQLAAHHLPLARFDPAQIVTSPRFVEVDVSLAVVPADAVPTGPDETPSLVVRRAVRTAVRRLFHPLHGGPEGTAPRLMTAAAVRTAVLALPEVRSVAALELRSEPDRQVTDDAGRVTAVRVLAGELADVRLLLELRP